MTALELIQQHLPQELREKAKGFTIPEEFLVSMSDLVILILNSKSMDTVEEKQSWFNLMPMMNQEQIAKLKDILTRERQKLEEIEQKYEKKKWELREKYTQKRDDMVQSKRIEEIKQEEAQYKEQQDPDSLLSQL